MPDDPAAIPKGSELAGGQTSDGQEPAGTPEPSAGDTTKTDAERMAEKDSTISRMAGELGFLKSQAQTQDKLAGVLDKLGMQVAPKAAEAPPLNWDDVEKALEDGDSKYVSKLLQDIVTSTAGRSDVSKAEKAMLDRIASLEAQVQDVQPGFLKHRDAVAELHKQFPNADRETLVGFATVLDASKPTAPPADTPPGSTESTRVAEPAEARQITPEAQAMLNKALAGVGGPMREGELKNVLGGPK